jgi:hypothetical protein
VLLLVVVVVLLLVVLLLVVVLLVVVVLVVVVLVVLVLVVLRYREGRPQHTLVVHLCAVQRQRHTCRTLVHTWADVTQSSTHYRGALVHTWAAGWRSRPLTRNGCDAMVRRYGATLWCDAMVRRYGVAVVWQRER